MNPSSKTILKSAIIGAFVGYVILHPVSMLIIAKTMPSSMAGMGQGSGMVMGEGIMDILMEALMAHHLVMSLYFTVLGLSFGFLIGLLYSKILNQNDILFHQKHVVEETLHERETLLRILSHDLTNQVGAGASFGELLSLSKSLDKEAKENLEILRGSLSRALQLINFSRTLISIESGKISMNLVDVSIQEIIMDTLPSFEFQMKQKNLKLSLDLPQEPLIVGIEPTIFSNTILGNLMSNAIKFSNLGSTILISAKHDGKTVSIALTNYGPAISPDRQKNLFALQAQTTTPGTLGERGSGLGLPLVSKFVKLMGGTISVVSTHAQQFSTTATIVITVLLPLRCAKGDHLRGSQGGSQSSGLSSL